MIIYRALICAFRLFGLIIENMDLNERRYTVEKVIYGSLVIGLYLWMIKFRKKCSGWDVDERSGQGGT